VVRSLRFAAGCPSLTGVSHIHQLLAKLIDWMAAESPKGLPILDFTNILHASANFLHESHLAFDYVRAYKLDVFPVIAAITTPVLE
jgi:hypothetical protein